MPNVELNRIVTQGGKELPKGTLLKLRLGSLPGRLDAWVQLPGQEASKLYPHLEVHGGEVVLPLKLAFLSHAKEDASFVRKLAGRLRQDGVLTWFDEQDILPGDDWKRKIDDAIERSDFVLVFLSNNSVSKTGYFQVELKYALEQHRLRPDGARYIIPIIIDACEPPSTLKDIHWLRADASHWYELLLRALVV